MHGYSLKQVIGKQFVSFVKDVDQALAQDIYSGNEKNLTAQVYEYRRLKRSGESFPTEIQGKTTRYDNRLSSIGICRDITERVKIERLTAWNWKGNVRELENTIVQALSVGT